MNEETINQFKSQNIKNRAIKNHLRGCGEVERFT